ncbi:hypothetical protein Pyn_09178 [Prunus yedoensis var. nudiflora]|uniref:Uncharacterized protein n=1 Tax=Prunus yedoensis var. nudiflora TaxID=2094558 RepID=A0A314Y2C7_PRUYE|nr:hypothetical protein Pyn_09178 [Prunus yedoensis var. nudiflora]
MHGLNEVGSLEITKADESEADDGDGVEATETNKGSPGGDETSPDTPKKDQLGDVTAPDFKKIKPPTLQSKGLNEVGSLEMPEADKSEADDVDGVKATEINKGSPGGDEISPDTQKKDQLGDVTKPEESEDLDPADNNTTVESYPKAYFQEIKLLVNRMSVYTQMNVGKEFGSGPVNTYLPESTFILFDKELAFANSLVANFFIPGNNWNSTPRKFA